MPVKLGRRSYHKQLVMEPGLTLNVGHYCQLGDGLWVLGGGQNHRQDGVSCFPWQAIGWEGAPKIEAGRVAVIENDVWIGARVTLKFNITLGNGCIVGAHSMVTKDVPPYAVVAGTPAKIIRYRFDPDTIANLLRIAWWDWPEEQVRAAVSAGHFNSVAEFVRRYA